jgi:hypothetical protein
MFQPPSWRIVDARAPRRAGHLLRQSCPGSLNRGDGPRRPIDQRFNDDGRNAGTLHVERVGRTRREVKDVSASIWTPIVDFDDDRAAIVEVRHFSA